MNSYNLMFCINIQWGEFFHAITHMLQGCSNKLAKNLTANLFVCLDVKPYGKIGRFYLTSKIIVTTV